MAYLKHIVSALHVEKRAHVEACKVTFNQLQSEALSPPDSVALIDRLAADL